MRTILISGCSSGIGLETARHLARRGWRVFATARSVFDVENLAKEGLESLQMDVDDSASIDLCVDEVLDRTGGRLDAVFSNAGYGQVGAVEDLTREAIRAQMETNLYGSLELINRIIPIMRRQGHGRILFNSSVLGYSTLPFRGAYSMSKWSIEALASTLRLELPRSIHVSLIEPGPITSQFRDNCKPHFLKHIDWQNSLHRTQYEGQMARLDKPGPAAPFTLPASAVVEKVVHALEASKPRARYQVTVPAILFWWLRRLLPTSGMDWVLKKASGGGKR
ncbi:MAG: short-chain dehydrogenase [Halothiobacillus sp. 13-55-115]|nr:MAG: short-chain dehydrogenase [Halothiobacillus sp. 13-55-115]